MKIENKSAESVRAELIRDIRGADTEARGARTEGPTEGELSEERIAEIRTRILEGAYNSLEVIDEVVRRILRSGDI